MGSLWGYRAFLQGRTAPVLEGLTGEQRFFLGWAQARCTHWTEDATRNRSVSDPHSPNAFRVIGPTQNIDAWYELSVSNTGIGCTSGHRSGGGFGDPRYC